MLRIKETEDIDARTAEVEAIVTTWRQTVANVNPKLREMFRNQLRISIIHHDGALEGEVLTQSEIKAAIDPDIISDQTLIPSYDDVKHLNQALDYGEAFAATKKARFDVEMIRDVYAILAPEEKAKGLPFRKENPLHRLYYHDIVGPEKIGASMKKLGEWWDSEDATELQMLERIVALQQKFMAVFPWVKESGRCIRVISNMLLLASGYPYAIIHSQDRQKYYEALRGDQTSLLSVYLEAIQTTAQSEMRVYDEALNGRRR
ncbi:MAG: Fic family protein [Myxococcales bacterium]|nr:Fic family protein [Myxococcales bacterium]